MGHWLDAIALLFGFGGSYVVPLDHSAIQYEARPVADPVTKAAGAKLRWDGETGYLKSVLATFKIPIESQVLVFSKTSFQAARIGPTMPRALYFNDSVYIGYVRGGDVLEVAALDPSQGVIFYSLDQDQTVTPRFERRDAACLHCHHSGATVGVPGLMVRSVYPERSGMPLFQAGSFMTDHRSPMNQRWGGWFVTGTPNEPHMGNRIAGDRAAPEHLSDAAPAYNPDAYLAPSSDVVALMVLEHQSHMTNLLVRLGWEARMAMFTQKEMNRALNRPPDEVSGSAERRIASGVDEVASYMLFDDEAKIARPIAGDTGFAKRFVSAGPADAGGRSLREFDLKTRMFRYPLSYMIYSPAFDALPDPARERLYKRLWDRLETRKDIREIVRDTKSNLPDYWRALK